MGSRIRRQKLPVSAEEAFSRHASSGRWPEWMADLSGTPQTEGDGGPGTIVRVKNRVFGIPQPATVEVTECESRDGGGCWTGKVEGLLFTATEKATFSEAPDGAEFVWRWDFTPKVGSTGGMVDRLVGRIVDNHMDACLRELGGTPLQEAPAT